MSGSAILELDANEPQRRSRIVTERTLTEGEDIVIAGSDGGHIETPEDALHAARLEIEQRDQLLATERDARTRAEREAQRMQTANAQNRGAAIAAQVEAATTSQVQAEAALRTARESGDLEAEIAATRAMTAAQFRLEALNAEHQRIKLDPNSDAGNVQQPASQQNSISAATQQWIDAHPRFNSDAAYRQKILDHHYEVVRDGTTPESPAYFRAMNSKAAELDGGGNTPTQRTTNMADQRGNDRFDGARPSQGSGSSSGGNTVQTGLGPVTVIKRGGQTHISIPVSVRADFEEGAKVCGMSLEKYALEQVKISQEQSNGGSAGSIFSEGRTYR